MNILLFTRALHFILSQGEDIAAQMKMIRDFAVELAAEFKDQVLAKDDETINAFADEAAEKYTALAVSCAAFDKAEGPAAANNARGAFRDLFRFVIANPDQVVDLINLFRDLFGLEAQGEGEAEESTA